MTRVESEKLFTEALKYIPGGVNSPVRAFRAVGGQPFFVNRAKGAHVWDVDGNEYIDYVGTWGPAILGHAHPKIIAAVKAAASTARVSGFRTRSRSRWRKLICELVPSVQKVRMCNSGTEASMSRDPPGARVHEAGQDHQVRRLLSRPRRFAAGESRLRRADLRPSRQRRRARRLHAAHDRGAVQRPRGRQSRVRGERGPDRGRSLSSRCRATPDCICRSRVTWNSCARSRRKTARC